DLAKYGTLTPGCTGWHNDNLLFVVIQKIVASQSAITNSLIQLWDASDVSSFFRNPVVFEVLAQSLLPRLTRDRDELRVWSAGCAAGEEAYSIAILIQEEIKRIRDTTLHSMIFATDIDREVLKKAAKAVYPRESLKDAKLGIVDTYFEPLRDGFKLCAEVKKTVHFSEDDLLSPRTGAPAESIYGSFDLVLCRNVLIYFSDKRQKQVFRRLYNALAKGGYLVLGDSETICRDLKSRFKTIDAKNKIYQKYAL
ncbi:MAG: protein-glutamate O-methyltransferase CheR, partial [Verrucomicrobia bacterium]|nr:protein-glutamate O-methyltransferase CheR [Verrucomicrobiota bacterium]